jgi:serine/threonine protein kinase
MSLNTNAGEKKGEVMDNLIGKDLGRYHILEPFGEGDIATVYKVYDTRLERDVAVKIIRPTSSPQLCSSAS